MINDVTHRDEDPGQGNDRHDRWSDHLERVSSMSAQINEAAAEVVAHVKEATSGARTTIRNTAHAAGDRLNGLLGEGGDRGQPFQIAGRCAKTAGKYAKKGLGDPAVRIAINAAATTVAQEITAALIKRATKK